jgi:hypothetical protein
VAKRDRARLYDQEYPGSNRAGAKIFPFFGNLSPIQMFFYTIMKLSFTLFVHVNKSRTRAISVSLRESEGILLAIQDDNLS